MKKILLTTTGLVGLAVLAVTGPTSAADMAVKAPPPPLPRCANFDGFYVGGNGGWGYHDNTWTSRDSWASQFSAINDGPQSQTGTGGFGGAQVGYNFQRGCSLFGFETDWNWSKITQTQTLTDSGVGLGLDTLTVSSEVKWFGTLRTRTGIVVDNVLLYVTGGLAYARFNNTATLTNFVGAVNTADTFQTDRTRWGWTGGVGAEWQYTSNWSIKTETLYMKFKDQDSQFTSPLSVLLVPGNNPVKRFGSQDSIWVSRIGVNYRFGG